MGRNFSVAKGDKEKTMSKHLQGGGAGTSFSVALRTVAGDENKVATPETPVAAQIINLAYLEETEVLIDRSVEEAKEGRPLQEIFDYMQKMVIAAYTLCLKLLGIIDRLEKEIAQDAATFGPESAEDRRRQQVIEFAREEMNKLANFYIENSELLIDEAKRIPDRLKMVMKIALRMPQAVFLARLVSAILMAETKNELQKIFENSKDAVGTKVFCSGARNGKNRQFGVFGVTYELTPNAFGALRQFAEEKISEAVQSVTSTLTATNDSVAEIPKQQEDVSEATSGAPEIVAEEPVLDEPKIERVKPERLLFGDLKHVNGTQSFFCWDYNGRKQGVWLQRVGDCVSVVGAEGGAIVECLDKLSLQTGEDCPMIPVRWLLDSTGNFLRPGYEKEDGRVHYDFSDIKEDIGIFLKMLLWILNGARHNCPTRIKEAVEQTA